MKTLSFSRSVLEANAEEIAAVKSNFAESARAAESARRAVEKFTANLTKVQKGLSKVERGTTRLRPGTKTLNPKSFRQFVLDALEHGTKTVDELTSSARGAGYVSTSKNSLRSSIESACRFLVSEGNVKSVGNSTFKL